jgi:5'-methylthioadenosine phosphorylase
VTVVARDLTFETPYGPSRDWKIVEFDGAVTADGRPRRALYVFSHGTTSGDEIDHEGHRKVFWVMREAGVRRIVASSTSGSLNRGILAGDLVIASDILELTQSQYSLLPGRLRFDASGKQMICPECSDVVERLARDLWPVGNRVYGTSAQLVCAHAWGPRLTTPAEVMAYRSMGADFINHSFAPEVTLAREIGACITNVSFITAPFTAYFTPPGAALLGESPYAALGPIASRLALRTIAMLPGGAGCLCSGLLSAQDPANHANR